ncbi:MAG TPA: type II toxin-antitoxin system VapC family toxin [Planctomycetota bacterium]|nr:type II toxin-antitoxin system VapC family toxin [Planctomycetota bacterium]
MSAAFVLDASLALSWCFSDEATAASRRIQDRLESETAVVPGLWFLEVANVLALAERRKKLTAAATAELVTLFGAFDLEVDDEASGRAFGHLLPICRAHGLSAYDAVYLDLALRRRLPLATLDDELRSAGRKLGLDLLGK